ncbi:hypothetical protein BST47_07680 [Mycolicibacterium tusciae]|uniref:Uncharacterized protein n=1 Tax=Mycolicibacterium tusciae TaxID=75922 RepID=A0A1X0JVN1_9MYCO|nr:hypothetical protein BST47_07680 [Mycolicibacterium tusciae]
MARTRDELLGFLREQVDHLEASNELYDSGRLSEAKRMALAVRILLHHTAPRYTSHALINQLGLENTLTWVDTAGLPDPTNLLSTPGLTRFKITAGDTSDPEYEAKLGDYPPTPIRTRGGPRLPRGSRVPFDEWWTNTVIKDAAGTEYSRRKLVLALSNKEGGAHVDPVADADYDALAKSNSLGWSVEVGEEDPRPMAQNPVFPSMRQISYEVLESIRQQRDRIK